MEIRVLKYFLAIAREQSFSAAAEKLYVTQPTLSRQIAELEEELGVRLFVRGSKGRKLTLTEEGNILKKRGEELIALMDRTENELKRADEDLMGDLYIGCAETKAFSLIAAACEKFIKKYPYVRLHLYSANANDVTEKMKKGLLDFGLLIGPVSLDDCEYIRLPMNDQWGPLVSAESELAEKTSVSPDDFASIPLIISDQAKGNRAFAGWLKKDIESLNVICRYNLLYNAVFLVAENIGSAVCLEGLIPSDLSSRVSFIPLAPALCESIWFVWNSSSLLNSQALAFLNCLQDELEQYEKKKCCGKDGQTEEKVKK